MHLGVLPPAPHPSHSSPLSLHDALPISSSRHLFPHSIAELREKFHRKTRAISPKFYLLSQNFHSTIIKLQNTRRSGGCGEVEAVDPRPIGVFDSGFGGLTAVRQLRRIMPSETIIYFGDTARVPYGNRSRDTLLRY